MKRAPVPANSHSGNSVSVGEENENQPSCDQVASRTSTKITLELEIVVWSGH